MRVITLGGALAAPTTAIHFAPDGLTLAAVWRFDSWVVGLTWFDLRQGAAIDLPPGDPDYAGGAEEDAGYAPDPVLSADHRFLAYVYIERGPEYSLRLIDRSAPKKSRRRERRLAAPGYGEYQALLFSPDGRFLVAAMSAFEPGVGEPNGVYRWRVDSALAGRGQKFAGGLLPQEELVTPHPVDVSTQDSSRTLTFAPDGSVLAGGLWRRQLARWEFPSGQALPPLAVTPRRVKRSRHHPDPAPPSWRLAFSADGQTLAVADERVTLYEARTGTPRAALSAGPAVPYALGHPPGPYVHDLAFHPSEPLLATACGDEVLRWWDGRTGSPRQTFDCGVGPLTAVAFSPDGCVCAAAGSEGRVALVDVDR